MQITPPQSVSQITAPAGTGQDPPHGHNRSAADILRTERTRAEQLLQSAPYDPAAAVRQARIDLLNGTLETEAAFADAANALLTRGI